MPSEDKATGISLSDPPNQTFSDLSGLDQVARRLREAVVTPATNSERDQFGARSILIHGPTGVGKTHVARSLLGELEFEYIEVSPAALSLDDGDQGARQIKEILECATETQHCAIFIDGLELVAPAEAGTFDDEPQTRSPQVIAQLCSVLDKLDQTADQVLLVATTESVDAIDGRVLRAGRIDVTLGLSALDTDRQQAVFVDELASVEAAGVPVEVDDETIETISENLDNQTIAEIVALVERVAVRAKNTGSPVTKEVFHAVVERPDEDVSETGESDAAAEITFGSPTPDDDGFYDDSDDDDEEYEFDEPFVEDDTDTSGDRWVLIDGDEGLNVTFDDVGGLTAVKQRLHELIVWPRKYPDRFEALDLDTSKGVLLYGPLGTGKTLLAKAITSETESTFMSVSGPAILDKYVGESERFIRDLFEEARNRSPTIVFMDEIDAFTARRGGVFGWDCHPRQSSQPVALRARRFD